jgi:hypothetical protein
MPGDPEPTGAPAMRARIDRLRDDLNELSRAIREEIDWRNKLYPIAEDSEDDIMK